MGTDINNKENEDEKINEDDIIENDCYEEIDMRKINQIIEKEKNWNNNTIVYNNIINISNELENINEQNPKSEDENNEKEIIEEEKEHEQEQEQEQEQEKENPKPELAKLNNNNDNKKSTKKFLHIMPKIRPQNTSDEELNKEKSSLKENQNKKDSFEKNILNKKKKEQSNENNINKMIPKNKLKNKKEDEVIYSGTLEKILNEPQANKIVYTSRFCVLTKKYFAYYKSKESYISLNRPMLMIEKDDIIRIENTFLEGEGYFGIVCEVNDKTKHLIDKVNSFVTNDDKGSQLLLGFRSNKYEDMANWILMLNYFISEKNVVL